MIRAFRFAIFAAAVLAGFAGPAPAQSIDVTFRFIPDLTQPAIEPVATAFVPGSFNGWEISSSSEMTYASELDEYRYTIPLSVGSDYYYRLHYRTSAASSSGVWINDPLAHGPCVYGQYTTDCHINISNPLAFQPAREENSEGLTYAVSAGVFGTEEITAISFQIDAGAPQDGIEFFDAETGIFRYVLPEPLPSPIYFGITVTDAADREARAETGIVPPSVVDQPRPAGLRNGITYVDDSTVRFSLFAPYKGFVHLIGDFNDWQISDEYVLNRDHQDDDNVWWWFELDGLTPGQEYAFQYVVDGTLRIADPYSEKVLDPHHDGFISSTTYPNLKPYPTGETSGIVGVIHPGREPYVWQTTGYERPAYQDLVVYELLIRDFIGARNFQTLRDTLDYLERLGINAISLMPVSEFDGNNSWGYNPSFHAALDKAYGTRRAFKEFVDAAHGRGIAVILDVVYNHATGNSPIIQLYGSSQAQNPLLGPGHAWSVFHHLNHDHPFIHDYMDQANARWLSEYRVDGFRFDLTKGFATNVTNSTLLNGYNGPRIANLKRMADAMWAVDDSAYVILEHFAANTEEQELAAHGRDDGRPGMLMWGNMNHAYGESSMGHLGSANLSSTYPPNRGMPVDGLLTYMESHDEQWLMLKNLKFGNATSDYDVKELPTALDRQKLVGSFFFTVPGPRMLWQFGELGYGGGARECLKPGDGSNGDCLASDPGRTAEKPLPWTFPRQYHLDPDRQRLYKTWAALINLRRSHPVFTSPEAGVQLRVGAGQSDRRIKLSHDGVQVVIIGNFGLTPQSVNPDFHRPGTWYEFFSDTAIEVTDTSAGIWLEPGQARIYSTIDFPSPDAGIYAVSAEGDGAGPLDFALLSPFPNPASHAATIEFTLGGPEDVRLEVFDLLGRRVSTLVDEYLPAGQHDARLDGSALPSGTYVVRLQAGENVAVTRVTMVR